MIFSFHLTHLPPIISNNNRLNGFELFYAHFATILRYCEWCSQLNLTRIWNLKDWFQGQITCQEKAMDHKKYPMFSLSTHGIMEVPCILTNQGPTTMPYTLCIHVSRFGVYGVHAISCIVDGVIITCNPNMLGLIPSDCVSLQYFENIDCIF